MAELSQRYGIREAKSNAEVVRESDVVILAVKPQIMVAVLGEIRPALGRRDPHHLHRGGGLHGQAARDARARRRGSSA